MTTYCSQNLGAGKIDRIRRGVHSGLVVALACSFVGAGIIFSLGDKIALLFFDASETAVLANVCHFLRVGTFFYPVLAIMYIYRNSVQGLGYSFVAMGGGMIEMVTRVTVATVFVPMFKFNAACIAQPTSWIPVVLAMIPSFYLLLRKEGRKRMEEGTQN
jgi:Na+-driven multidrug efflux pump